MKDKYIQEIDKDRYFVVNETYEIIDTSSLNNGDIIYVSYADEENFGYFNNHVCAMYNFNPVSINS